MGSFGQSAFGAGEWDTASLGRIDHPWHRRAMAVSVNGQPGANEAWHKRSGTKWLGPTFKRLSGVARPCHFDTANRFSAVVTTDGTTGWVHFFKGDDSVHTNASATVRTSSSASGILTIITTSATGWAVDDDVIFERSTLAQKGYAYLNRWLKIATISTTTITLKDETGTAFTFNTAADAVAGATVKRISRFTTGFLADLDYVQVVNLGASAASGYLEALLLHPAYPTKRVTFEPAGQTFTVATASFTDGPYFADQGTGSVSAYSGTITFTPTAGQYTFVAGDVARHIRLFSEPAAWASGTTYVVGDRVKYNNKWWKCVYAAGAAGIQPGTLYTTSGGAQVLVWAPLPDAGQWGWGTITAQAGTSCTVALTTNLNSANGATISSWRRGLFGNGVYPFSGILYLGRLYLAADQGRFDASKAGSGTTLFTFSPTDTYGYVYDDYAFGDTVLSGSQDLVVSFQPDRNGLLISTYAEEFLLTGGGADDNYITPFSKNVRRVSSYGSFSRPAVLAGISVVFLQKDGHTLYEYVTDGAPSARPLNEFNYNLVVRAGGLTDLAYTETKLPVIWARASDGQLFACTYRRSTRSMASMPDMAGWGRHKLADGGRTVRSLCALAPYSDEATRLILTTATTSSSYGIANGVERMMPFWLREEGNTL